MKNTEKVIFEGYPKRMMVWNDGGTEYERIVLCCVPRLGRKYLAITDDGIPAGWHFAKDIAPEKPRTIEDGLVQGDVIVNAKGYKVEILGIAGEAIFTSFSDDLGRACQTIETKANLIKKGWKLELESTAQEPALVELTIQDISEGKGAGVDPKFIRIKDMVRIDL
jgi:hypothetical protein